MKTIKKYVCEVCRTEFNDEEKAAKCEKNHGINGKIASTKYYSIGVVEDGLPINITVEFSNGKTAVYKR